MAETLNDMPSFINLVNNITGSKTEKGAVFNVNGTKRYYSSVDINIYIGNTYVDEVVNMAVNIQQNTMPLFGYNSYVYDDVAQGSRFIKGMFTINMTKPRFLFDILETAKKESSIFFVKSDGSVTTESNTASNNATTTYGDSSKAMWDVGFDLDIAMGTDYSSHYILTGVILTGCSMQEDGSGENIKELYSFIAKSIETV